MIGSLLTVFLFLISPTIQMDNAPGLVDVSKYEFLIQEAGDSEIKDIISNLNFKPVISQNPNFGLGPQSVWLRFKVVSAKDLEEQKYLLINNPNLDEVYFYQIRDGKVISSQVSGRTHDFGQRLIPSRKLIFEINSESGQNSDIYLNIRSSDKKIISASIADLRTINKSLNFENILFGLFSGILFGLFFYNLFLYFSLNDYTYLIYVAYIFLVWLGQSSILGYAQELLWPEWVWMNLRSNVVFSVLGSIVAIWFVQAFLKTRLNLPKLNKGLQVIYVVYLIILSGTFFGFLTLSYAVFLVTQAIVIPYVFIMSLYILKSGFKPARYFLIAWSVFMVGILLFVLTEMGLIPFSPSYFYLMPFGAGLGVILLSFALADRINDQKREYEKEQYEKLKLLEEHESRIIEQNEFLEEKVKQRTEELELTLHNLQNTQTQLVNQEKMASLGQLTAGIAHEINNPINFVSSNISPLKRDINDLLDIVNAYREKGKLEFSDASKKDLERVEEDIEFDYILKEIEQLLRGMEEGAKRTVEIVKGLRLFSRVDEQDVKRVDIHDGINSTLILLNSSMSGKIQVYKEFGSIPIIECLPGKLNQVFMNIITNAIHALLENLDKIPEPKITIRTIHVGEKIRIEIEDNGFGMPAHVKQRIFEPFFTTKAVGKGTGLGLSIVYTIIENHKGTLEVSTEQGKGTNFIITLPIYQNIQQHD
ncbi:sensor histidine kinase [Aquiflexum gelatinilyticum]|uniref:sensor histidine kinase n=1 Tax=Aquiflexum gelatinilyticum TaxID=2961943 RepID=UPI00216A7FD9|nr:sensor histidine kinase [Aquiflexum gelatinilyticum]MCS4436370.1 sensor histidine kinase [Aquiflexum gelatinilyticum]